MKEAVSQRATLARNLAGVWISKPVFVWIKMKGFRRGLLPRQTHLHYRLSKGWWGRKRNRFQRRKKNPENPGTEADFCITKGEQRKERCWAWEWIQCMTERITISILLSWGIKSGRNTNPPNYSTGDSYRFVCLMWIPHTIPQGQCLAKTQKTQSTAQ